MAQNTQKSSPPMAKKLALLGLLLSLLAPTPFLDAAQQAPPRSSGQKPAVNAPRHTIPQGPASPTPTIKWMRPYDGIDGQPSYAVTYRRTVALDLNIGARTPTHYRASESPSFAGSSGNWLVFYSYPPPRYTFAQDTPGQKTIYFQLMNNLGQSNVASGFIEYRKPPVLQQLTINGGQPVANERDVTVNWTFSGSATLLYLSENPSFSGVHPLVLNHGISGNTSFRISEGFGSKTIFAKLVDTPLPFSMASPVMSGSVDFHPYRDQIHDLRGNTLREFFQLAHDNGYGFTSQLQSGKGTCTQYYQTELGGLRLQAKTTLPALPADQVNCLFFLLEGKMLRSGWKILGVEFDWRTKMAHVGCHYGNILHQPTGTGPDPKIRLEVPYSFWCSGPSPSNSGWIKQMKLEGPSNEDWRLALQP